LGNQGFCLLRSRIVHCDQHSRNPAGEFKPSDVLPQRTSQNHARVEESELPELLRKIEAYQGTPSTRFAIKLLALTFVLTSELIEATSFGRCK
jgi:hypothetical protein